MTEEWNGRYLAAKRKLFERYYGARLNPEQVKAVLSVSGPLLILAGAGSGKTTVLVNRICHIVKYGTAYETDAVPKTATEADAEALERAAEEMPCEQIEGILASFATHPCPPWAMLAITFTNKAADEIKTRLAAALPGEEDVSGQIWAGTFHSVCVRMLRKFSDRAGLPSDFSIYDASDQKHLISDVMKELDIDEKILPLRSVINEISAAKDKLISPEEYPTGADLRQRHIAQIYAAYQEHLARSGAVDFDDIIMKTVRLLEENQDVAEYYQRKFEYVCIDEYQDTNPAQFRLSYLLSAGRRNLMVVGDDDQSIYKFRGATIENILHFDTTYPDARVVKLEQNYRSTGNILAAANAVIAHNRDRHEKKLWSDKETGEKITVYRAATADDECRYIVDTVLERKIRENRSYGDFAVLYRVNALSRQLEETFAKSGIPHRLLGGTRFYDRKEIKDILAYLTVIINPNDELRLARIVNEPKRKIGERTVATVAALAAEEGTTMFAVMKNAASYPAIERSADKLTAFTALIESLQNEVCKPSALVPLVMERTGYMDMLRAGGEEMRSEIENLNELVSAVMDYEEKTEEPTLAGFLEGVALISDIDQYDPNAPAVALMTIHSAKGLEFPMVFIAGAEEGIFPGTQSISDPTEMSEERRLAYVAITRAKEKLTVSCAAERLLYGATQHYAPSRFFSSELPDELVEKTLAARPAYERAGYMPQTKPPVLSDEFTRRASVTADYRKPRPPFTKLLPGDRVRHTMFGEGEVLSVRDLGADALYEVRFDDGVTKKLMATYAKLEKI